MKAFFVIALLSATLAQAQVPAPSLALVIGDNRGLAAEETLHYAQTDALSVRDALVEVGGFSHDNVTVRTGITADDARAEFARLTALLEQHVHERLVVYISSHADDGALHLAGTSLPMSEVVDFVKRAKVRVGLLVVDACRSGAMTKLKGLKPGNADLAPTHIEATQVEGRVFISASGADEYAQESEALQGSTFTHHFVTGLRGAADSSHDGLVTLEEAYDWAWSRTIEATFASRGGVQRPNFSVDLRGQGQLVLSAPRDSRSRLVIDVRAPGRWLVVSNQTGAVVAEVDKPAGSTGLALPAGSYRVRLRTDREVLERRVQIPADGTVTISGEDLESASFVRVATKGAPDVTLLVSAAGGVVSGLVSGLVAEPQAELRVRRDAHLIGPINEIQLDLAARSAMSIGVTGFRQLEFELRVGAGHFFRWSQVSVAIGVELGPLVVHQTDVPGTLPIRTSLALVAAACLELRVEVYGPVQLVVTGLGGGVLAKKPEGLVVIPRLGASLGVGYAF